VTSPSPSVVDFGPPEIALALPTVSAARAFPTPVMSLPSSCAPLKRVLRSAFVELAWTLFRFAAAEDKEENKRELDR
jgi:hypothetical protein